MITVFSIAGDIGDAIYSLPVVKKMGGGDLRFWQRRYVREPMTPAKVERIATFFASQSYIHSVGYNNGVNPRVNLDDFRSTWIGLRKSGVHLKYNLAELFLLTFSFPLQLATEQWLDIPTVANGPQVIFNRTFRYRNNAFPWKAAWSKYRNVAVFLGTPEEHREFVGNVGNVPCIPTPTLLDAARLIAGCKLFIGNQSALYAVAEGLKVPRVLEIWRTEPNCLFPGAIHGWDASVKLPDI